MAGPSSQNGRSTTRQASTATGPDEALLQLWRIRGVSAPSRARLKKLMSRVPGGDIAEGGGNPNRTEPSKCHFVEYSNGRTQVPAGATLGPCWVRQAWQVPGWSLF